LHPLVMAVKRFFYRVPSKCTLRASTVLVHACAFVYCFDVNFLKHVRSLLTPSICMSADVLNHSFAPALVLQPSGGCSLGHETTNLDLSQLGTATRSATSSSRRVPTCRHCIPFSFSSMVPLAYTRQDPPYSRQRCSTKKGRRSMWEKWRPRAPPGLCLGRTEGPVTR